MRLWKGYFKIKEKETFLIGKTQIINLNQCKLKFSYDVGLVLIYIIYYAMSFYSKLVINFLEAFFVMVLGDSINFNLNQDFLEAIINSVSGEMFFFLLIEARTC